MRTYVSVRTYVAVIDGKAHFAFLADNYVDALALIHSRDGALQSIMELRTHSDGTVVWNGRSEIIVRLATDEEHMRWVRGQEEKIEIGGIYGVIVPLVPVRIDWPEIL